MSFGWVDWSVLAAYFAITLLIGLWFGRRERSTHDFFLGGRRQHWLLAGMSIIATEVSALTVIAVPGSSFQTDWSYLQMYAGSFIGRILIVLLLLPAFYGGSVTTVYEYLGQRFGPWTRTTASLFFFASRIFGSGIRMLVACLALSEIFQWRLEWVVIGATGIAMIYATYGGIKAILWTDAFQALVYIAAACLLVGLLFFYTPGHWTQNFGDGYYARKFHTFTWTFDPTDDKGFWLLTLHAIFVTMAAMGTDQDLTQRMLTCSNLRQSQKSLIFNAFAGFPIVCVFLLVGTLLFLYYESRPFESLPDHVLARHELILPYFISHGLPSNRGLQGIMVAAVFAAAMGSLSSAIGALASTAVTDFYRPFTRLRSEGHYLTVARIFTAFFGIILIVVALAFQNVKGSLLWAVFQWVSLVFGGMLGIFLLGVTTRSRGSDRLNVVAMVTSVAILVAIMLIQQRAGSVYIAWPWWIVAGASEDRVYAMYIAWPWWVVFGTVWTYGVAACARGRPSVRNA